MLKISKDPLTEYAHRVLDGNILAGPYVRQACQRHLNDMKRDDIEVDWKAVHLIHDLFKLLKHWQGEYAGQPFILSQWQLFVLGSVYGWRYKESGLRRFGLLYEEVPKKNGKTIRAAGVAILSLVTRLGDSGGEIYSVATKRDQARICWLSARNMIALSTSLKKHVQTYSTSLYNKKTFSSFSPLVKNIQGLDGKHPSLCIYDEFHAWRDREQRSKLRTGMAARKSPLEYIITTAGSSTESICYEMRTHALNVLNPALPDYDDDRLFAYIATPDPDDDVGDMQTWKKANPNLGHGKYLRAMEEDYKEALSIPSQMDDFLRYHLNIWVKASSHWLNPEDLRFCEKKFSEKSLEGAICYGGLDLGLTRDLSAFVLLFPPDEKRDYFCVLPYFWCPEDDIESRTRAAGVPYRVWEKEGYLRSTLGNSTDFRQILADIKGLASRFQIKHLVYDRVYASQLIQDLIGLGLECVPMGQTFVSMTAPVRELERLIISKKIFWKKNLLLTWCGLNAVLVKGHSESCRLEKPNDHDKIDGIDALVMALNGHMNDTKQEPESVYLTSDDYGMITLNL